MFIWSAFAHLIALTSPGPDTAIVIRQVSIHGRIEGITTQISTSLGFFSWTNKVLMKGFCFNE